jgi:hypothetical protein
MVTGIASVRTVGVDECAGAALLVHVVTGKQKDVLVIDAGM